MAFTSLRGGDRYQLGWNTLPKVPKSGYTPVVGDLVVLDTSVANGIDVIASTEGPAGIVESVNNSNGTYSVTMLVPGTTIELPYLTSVTLGQKAVFDTGTTHGTSLDRTKIGSDATNGTGIIIAKDADAPHGTGHCVVQF